MNLDELILNLPREQQEKYLRESLQEKQIDVFWALAKPLLNTPVISGGMDTEFVDKIFKEEMDEL